MNNKPNEAQIAALIRFAACHEGDWKAQLQGCWNTGIYQSEDARLLVQVRNQFGSAWLKNFQLERGEDEMSEFLARYSITEKVV